MAAADLWRWIARPGKFDWSELSTRRAARGALGVTLPLVIGWLTGHVTYGAYTALGALPAGFASFEGQTRSRLTGVVVASIGMALTTFAGATTAASAPWLLPALVAIWAYATGLSVCLGPVASVAVLQWSVALLIAIGMPFGPAEAALRSGLVLAGGLLQAALVAASWALRPGKREQTALAASFAALAAEASRLAAGSAAAPSPTTLAAAPVLDDPNPLLSDARRLLYLDLLEEAERVRAALAALAADATGPGADGARGLLSEAAAVLGLVAAALAAPPGDRDVTLATLGERVAGWAIPPGAPWRWSADALAAHMRAIASMLQALDAPGHPPRRDPGAPPQARGGAVARIAAQLRANMSITTEAGRHALRLAIVAALAEVLAQATGLTQGRWVTLTVLIVLKPDYGSTVQRGLHRAFGTALGAWAAAAVVQLGHGAPGALIVASAASVALAYAMFRVNYLVYSIPLTAFILLLLALLGMPAIANAEARTVDTVIGSVLGLLAYAAWPTWKGATAEREFAALLDALRDYGLALMREFAHPGSIGASRLRALQAAARHTRSDAEAGAARLAGEPLQPPFTPALATRLIGTIARVAACELALHALVTSRADDPASRDRARIDQLAAAYGTAMTVMAAALRRLEAPPVPSGLAALQGDPANAEALPAGAFATIVERLLEATTALHDLLRGGLERAAGNTWSRKNALPVDRTAT